MSSNSKYLYSNNKLILSIFGILVYFYVRNDFLLVILKFTLALFMDIVLLLFHIDYQEKKNTVLFLVYSFGAVLVELHRIVYPWMSRGRDDISDNAGFG